MGAWYTASVRQGKIQEVWAWRKRARYHCLQSGHLCLCTRKRSSIGVGWRSTVSAYEEEGLSGGLSTDGKQEIRNSVRIAPDISQHSHTLTETCQRQVKLNCGIHAIAMAVSFAMAEDPSAARHSHELMRNHLRQCFENKRLDKFPLPKAKERITLIQHKAPTNFKIPKLWHKLDGKSPTKPKTAKKFKKP